MSIEVKVRVNGFDILKVERELGNMSRKTPSVFSRSMNRAIQNMRTSANKKTRETYHLKASQINETMRVRKSSASRLYAEVKSSGKLIGLEKFSMSPRSPSSKGKSKIRVAVKRGPKKSIERSFIRGFESGKNIVMQRETKKRLPIRRLVGPSIPQVMNNEAAVKFVQKQGHETLQKRLDHEIARLVGR